MALPSSDDGPGAAGGGLVKSPLDLAGGLFLVALAILGFAGGFDLPFGTLSGIGSGLMPKVVATLVAVFGVLLLGQALVWPGDRLEQWYVRGPLFVLGSVLVFAMLIRGSTLSLGGFAGLPLVGSIKVPPLGLIVAGPLTVVVASLADRDTRPVEVVVYALVMTLICGLLFKELLNLPIPFDPAGLVPDAVNHAYNGIKSALGQLFDVIKTLLVG